MIKHPIVCCCNFLILIFIIKIDYLTGVKSPDNPIFTKRLPSMKDNDESSNSTSGRKYEANELSQILNNIYEILPTSKSSDISSRINSKIIKSESSSDQQKNEIQSKKSSISHDSISQQVELTSSSESSIENKLKSGTRIRPLIKR